MNDITKLEIYHDAKLLEVMAYQSETKSPHKYKRLWVDIIACVSACCDAMSDAYFIPKGNLDAKYNALSFAMSNLVKMERKLDIANSHDVQALNNEYRAKFDLQIHKVKVNLAGWLNSTHGKMVSQISAVMPVGEELQIGDAQHVKTCQQ